uniref:UPF0764 protein C16orf89 homolog n=1 Tax=Panagrellus redivivus TaxID=6233 RepID=A0A7E4V1G2_PANRE
MSPTILPNAIHLSWNNARLLALILNALTGFLKHADESISFLEADGVFALRLIEGQLENIYLSAVDRKGYHKNIGEVLQNITRHAGSTAQKAAEYIELHEPQQWERLSPLLASSYRHPREWVHRKVDERLRWNVKEHVSDKMLPEQAWFGNECLIELLSNPGSCEISTECTSELQSAKGLNGYKLTSQVFYLIIAKSRSCKLLGEDHVVSLDSMLNEYCANIVNEIVPVSRNPKKLTRIDQNHFGLLLEQIFVCGQAGFVEFVDTHLVVATLAWQHPTLGCWTAVRPEGFPNTGISGDLPEPNSIAKARQSTADSTCLPHLTAVATGVLISALRSLLQSSPWPEYHTAADHLVTIDKIVAEDRFEVFKYINWVRDTHFPADMRLPQPPPVAWAPDLIAFFALFFILLIGCIIAHNACNVNNNGLRYGHKKPLYPFAYKKL